jgi:hypothetical protein
MQTTAIARFNRAYAIKTLTLTNHPEDVNWIIVNATLKAGGEKTLERRFVLDNQGKLVSNADNKTDFEHISD